MKSVWSECSEALSWVARVRGTGVAAAPYGDGVLVAVEAGGERLVMIVYGGAARRLYDVVRERGRPYTPRCHAAPLTPEDAAVLAKALTGARIGRRARRLLVALESIA